MPMVVDTVEIVRFCSTTHHVVAYVAASDRTDVPPGAVVLTAADIEY